jgi:hypothetical protein
MTSEAKAGKRGLWGYLRIVLVALVVFVVLAFAVMIVNSHLALHRTNEFCDSFAIGAPFDLAKFEAEVKQVPNTRLLTHFASEGNGRAMLRFRSGFICSLGIENGIVATKKVMLID